MLVLRSFLYGTLLIFILWLSSILIGPLVITKVVSIYSGNHIRLHDVNVLPNLSVKIARIDFTSNEKILSNALSGSTRGFEVSFLLSEGSPQIVASAGSTQLDEFGSFKSIKFFLSYQSLFDWSDPYFNISFLDMNLPELFKADNVLLSTSLEQDKKYLKKINLLARNVETATPNVFLIPEISGELSGLSLEVPIQEQQNSIVANAVSIFSELKGSETITFKNVEIKAQNNNGILPFNVGFDNADLQLADVLISGMEIGGGYNLNSGKFEELSTLVADKVTIGETVAIADVQAELQKKADGFKLDAKAILESLIIAVNDQHIGKITNSNLSNSAQISFGSGSTKVTSLSTLSDAENPIWKANIDFEFDLQGISFSDCLNTYAACFLKIPKLGLNLEINGQSFEILTECLVGRCDLRSLSGYARTSDTVKVFEAVSAMNIFNPIVLTMWYIQLNSGEKNGLGHTLEF